jgi:acetyl esterase/lipase
MIDSTNSFDGIFHRRIDTSGLPPRSEGPPPEADITNVPMKHLDLRYAHASEAQKLDLYLPRANRGTLPLIIHIHGGAFMMCDKRDRQVQPWLNALDLGYAVASINYRMSGEAVFPAAVHDCKCAVRCLRARSGEYGLNPDRIAVVGGSAGGHLAAMLATTAGTGELEDLRQGYADYSSSVQACIDWFGPTDFLKMDEQLEALGLGPLDHHEADSPESRYLGGKITDLPYELIQKSNPITYINDDLPPILIVHGDIDRLVCVSQSRIFYDAVVEKLGSGRAALDILEGADHADLHFETGKNMARMFAFLDLHLKDG